MTTGQSKTALLQCPFYHVPKLGTCICQELEHLLNCRLKSDLKLPAYASFLYHKGPMTVAMLGHNKMDTILPRLLTTLTCLATHLIQNWLKSLQETDQ